MKKEPIFFNRELSWTEFNSRVLEEGLDSTVPLLERWKFMCIVGSNFDEFFMVRIATLKRQLRKGDQITCPSGLSPSKQLNGLATRIHEITEQRYNCMKSEIIPSLDANGLKYIQPGDYSDELKKIMEIRFRDQIFINLTPVKVEPDKEFPFTTNLRLHILFQLKQPDNDSVHYALLQLPPSLDRIQWLSEREGVRSFCMLEDIIRHNAGALFQGYDITDSCIFRITRDADLGVDEERDEDFLEAMGEIVQDRQLSLPVRLEVESKEDTRLRDMLIEASGLQPDDVYEIPGILGMKDCMGLGSVPGFSRLKDPVWKPVYPFDKSSDETLWDILKERDILLHHPYEAFDPVVRLIQDAAADPGVLAIKMILYRTSGNSPIVKALIEAAESGKQVSVLVELKARFDEERNISWAEQLQRAGAIVVYGIAHLKVHAKALLIVRKELEGIRRYAHLGTGNYNDKTARLYTDIGLLTSNEQMTLEVALVFNAVTGYSTVPQLSKIVMAPHYLKQKVIDLIKREVERSMPENPGLIMAKMNSLGDPDVIKELYKASQAGVKIMLNVRGICLLVPGVKGLSENIQVTSIVDRFLEHSRIFYFSNQGSDEIYLASADWMVRNLEKRVELMFPVEQTDLKKRIRKIIEASFTDNVKARILQPEGRYIPPASSGAEPFRCQEEFYRETARTDQNKRKSPKKEFTIRRSPQEGKPQ